MNIPDYQHFMLPLLKAVPDGDDHRMRDLTKELADQFGISEEDRQQILPSGQSTYVANRVAWAKTYLKKAGLIDSPARGFVRITNEGRRVLGDNPQKIDNEYLKRFQPFVEFYRQSKTDATTVESEEQDTRTPDEILEASYPDLRTTLADDLLQLVKSCSPRFFERLVIDLLVSMGYGGSLADARQAIGRTGDGGIDGIIKEDKLGFGCGVCPGKEVGGYCRASCRPGIHRQHGGISGTKRRDDHHIRILKGCRRIREQDRTEDRANRRSAACTIHD